jgi:hypothetical protein
MPNLENPCKKFINYSGDTGLFSYYNKETKKNVEVPMPLYFEVLDELSTITGFYEAYSTNLYSNEVSSLKTEILKVKCFGKGGVNIVGLYDNIKDSVKAVGGKFTRSVYAMLINSDRSIELVNFKFHGAALNGWIDKKFNVNNFITSVAETVQEKKGSTKYQKPVFVPIQLDPELDKKAIEMDKKLQAYLKEYKAKQSEQETTVAEAVTTVEGPAMPEENITYTAPQKTGWVKEDRKKAAKPAEEEVEEASSTKEPDGLPF